MGCKEARAQVPPLLYRTKSIRQLLEAKKAHDSGSFSSVIAEESRESRDSSRKEGQGAGRRLPTEATRPIPKPKATQVDVKAAYRIKQNRTQSLLLLKKPQSKPCQSVSPSSPFPLISPSPFRSSLQPLPAFDESDFSSPDPICLYSTGLFKKRPLGNEAAKPVQSSYKLLRASRKPASWDPTVKAEGLEGQEQSLVNILRESVDVGRGERRNRSIKQLVGRGNGLFSSQKAKGDTSLYDSIRGRQEDSEGKVTYSIKTPHAFQSKESETQRLRSARGKSRAERTWAWKGRKGAYEAN